MRNEASTQWSTSDPALFLGQQTRLRRLAAAIVGEGAAEDVVQDVWVAVQEQSGGEVREGGAWLGKVTRNPAWKRRLKDEHRAQREADVERDQIVLSGEEWLIRIDLVTRSLQMAIDNRSPGPGLIHHSDRGSQYASKEFRRMLASHGMLASMSRKGDCWDNVVMESFYRTPKVERVHRDRYKNRRQAKTAIFQFIETYYNTERMHSSLGYQSPNEFEAWHFLKAEAA